MIESKVRVIELPIADKRLFIADRNLCNDYDVTHKLVSMQNKEDIMGLWHRLQGRMKD